MCKIEDITLFQFYGHGDTLNVTWAPKLIKEKLGIRVSFACKKSHVCFFENNKYVDNIIIINEEKATQLKNEIQSNYFTNGLNVWCGSGKSKHELYNFMKWDIPLISAEIINNYFKFKVIDEKDNLLPEMFYTEDEIKKIDSFVFDNYPYVVIETECFSGQHPLKSMDIMSSILNNCKLKNIKIFTSCFKGNIISPFLSLNEYSLREVGLIIERSLAFYGVGSGMSVVSWERNLKEPKKRVISFNNNLWLNNLKRYREMTNTIALLPKDFISYVIKDINMLQ